MNDFFHLNLNRNPPGCRNANVPHAHRHHELLYALNGEGAQLSGDREFALQAGDLFFFPAGTRHCSIFLAGKRFECFVLVFDDGFFAPAVAGDKEVLDVLDKMGRFGGQVPLSAAGGAAIQRILEELLGEFHRKATAYHASLKMLTTRLLIAVARDREFLAQGRHLRSRPSQESLIGEVLSYLDAFYASEITIGSILEFCPMSRSHFHAVFKAATGKTLVQYLTDLRLEKAKEILLTTNTPVGEVAIQTGFRTPCYFGQVFRAATGTSPGEYRKRPSVRRTSGRRRKSTG